jgi:hypothetical protein
LNFLGRGSTRAQSCGSSWPADGLRRITASGRLINNDFDGVLLICLDQRRSAADFSALGE